MSSPEVLEHPPLPFHHQELLHGNCLFKEENVKEVHIKLNVWEQEEYTQWYTSNTSSIQTLARLICMEKNVITLFTTRFKKPKRNSTQTAIDRSLPESMLFYTPFPLQR